MDKNLQLTFLAHRVYTVSQNDVSFANLNRFSKFFHLKILEETYFVQRSTSESTKICDKQI